MQQCLSCWIRLAVLSIKDSKDTQHIATPKMLRSCPQLLLLFRGFTFGHLLQRLVSIRKQRLDLSLLYECKMDLENRPQCLACNRGFAWGFSRTSFPRRHSSHTDFSDETGRPKERGPNGNDVVPLHVKNSPLLMRDKCLQTPAA